MLRFDTLDKKPNVWSLAVLAAVTAAAMAFFLTRKPVPLAGVGWTVGIALALTIVILLRAFFRQLRYNPYSYNTIYYTAFALFFLAVLVFHIVLMFQARSWGLEDVVALPVGEGGDQADADGFNAWMKDYRAALEAERCAVNG